MNNLLVALVTAQLTVAFILLLRPIARAIGLVDRPDARKMHVGNIPLVGGIAIFLAVAFATVFGVWMSGRTQVYQMHAGWFLVGAFFLVVMGVWDDLRNLSPYVRIAVQICVGLIMIYGGGIVISDLGAIGIFGNYLVLGIFAVPFTVFVVVGIINAINMADGLDGLVGNLVLVTLFGLGAASALKGGADVAQMINVLSAAVMGFLIFNQRVFWRPKAAIFLGDAGSMMLGYALVWAIISLAQGPARVLTPAAALWFVAVPVIDTVSVSVRRLTEGKSPFHADSRHLHHLLVNAGFTVTETIIFMCALAGVGIVIGLGSVWLGVPDWIVVTLFVVIWYLSARSCKQAWDTGRFLGRELQNQRPGF
jgi:UDP-GlcNAc:undecaprenyl-phosphate GlcNAc-1-phosphate transferase